MKKIVLILSLLFTNVALADRDFGLGVIIGDPTGISVNMKTVTNRSLDFAVAYDFSGRDRFYVHSTYLFHNPNSLMNEKDLGLGWYSGIGGRAWFQEGPDDELRLGIRGAVGVNMMWTSTPLELFAELAPILDLVDETDFDLDAGIGARYYF